MLRKGSRFSSVAIKSEKRETIERNGEL